MGEQRYLREEFNMRLSMFYTHSNSTVTFVITLWSALIALFSVLHERIAEYFFLIFSLFPLIFLVTSFYIFFAAQKFFENLTQLTRISSYFACFYNEPLNGKINFQNSDSWELSTLEGQLKKKINQKNKKVLESMNGEYIFFCVLSVIFTLAITVYVLTNTTISIYFMSTSMIYLIYAILVVIVEFILAVRVYKLTSLKRIEKMRSVLILEWVEFGLTKEYFSNEDLKARFKFVPGIDKLAKHNKSKK